jgi:hypothetical protein
MKRIVPIVLMAVLFFRYDKRGDGLIESWRQYA